MCVERLTVTMKRHAPLIMAVGTFLFAATYLWFDREYKVGTPSQPGPGLFPLLIGAGMFLTSAGTVWQAARGGYPSFAEIEWPVGVGWWRIVAIVVASAAYILLIPYVGDLVTNFLSIVIIARVMGLKRWWAVLLVAAAMGFAFHFLFATLLDVPLPTGSLWDR